MIENLPQGWALAPIGMLCSLENGRAFKPTEWTTTGIPIVRIQNLNNPNASFNYFDQEYSDRYHLRGGELLFAWSGTPGTSFGAHVWRGGEAVLNQHIFRVDIDENSIDKRYFRYAINQKLEELINVAHGGVGLRHVTKGTFEKTEVTIPPLNEQKRIADKLEQLLAAVDSCKTRLDTIPGIIKRFRQAVLAVATSGDLTADWREKHTLPLAPSHQGRGKKQDEAASQPPSPLVGEGRGEGGDLPEIPESWQWVSVGTLAVKVSDGVHKKPDYVAQGIPFITVKNLTAGPGISFSDTNFVTQKDHEEFCKRTFPERGDILISKDGTLGVIRLVDTDRPFSIFVSVALVKLHDKRMSHYIHRAFESPVVQKQMVGVGTGLQHIHLRDLRQDLIPLPPLEEQTEIVRRVEALFAVADRLEARYQVARTQVDQLTPSLLAKAFRGELIPQDPNDEPAENLLERIKTRRAAGQQKTAPLKRGRKKLEQLKKTDPLRSQ